MDQAALADQTFYGTSENAVKTQIWIAVSMYVLVRSCASGWGWRPACTRFYRFSAHAFEKTPILCVLQAIDQNANFAENANNSFSSTFNRTSE